MTPVTYRTTCPRVQYRGLAPHLVMYSTMRASLAEEVALALKCLAHGLAAGVDKGPEHQNSTAICARTRYDKDNLQPL